MPSKKIIIIGAGIAGLAACTKLMKYGFDVMILEGRQRAGGRICTDYQLGLPIGCGAAWIHGVDGNPMMQLAQRFNINMVPADYTRFIKYTKTGQPISPEIDQAFETKFTELLKQAKKLAFDSKEDISLHDALNQLIQPNTFTAIEKDLFAVKLSFFQGYIGDDYEFLSARYWDQEEVWSGENCFLADSYQPIIDGLAKACKIHFNTIVTAVNHRESDVEIITSQGSFHAHMAIITLPLGVLKSKQVIFNPVLPNAKQQAINRLGMGLLNVCAIRFPTAFWPISDQAMIFTEFDDNQINTFINLQYFIKQPILLGYYGGELARHVENYSSSQLVEKTLYQFRKKFGKHIPDPESFFSTRWLHDPFSYGAYSYVATGASSTDYEELAKPIENRLFFAGEATSAKYLATTHGAYLSGIREADRIKICFT